MKTEREKKYPDMNVKMNNDMKSNPFDNNDTLQAWG